MKKSDRNAFISFFIVVLVAIGVAIAGSQHGAIVFWSAAFYVKRGIDFSGSMGGIYSIIH